MRGSLHAGGFQVIRVGDPREEQDAVNLRTLQASVASVTSAADTVVGNAANILNREIGTKSLNLDPQGTATKNFRMGGQYYIAGLPIQHLNKRLSISER